MTSPQPVSAAEAPKAADMDRLLIHSIAWMGLVKWAGQLVAWGSTFVVARLLSPTDYGVVGAASLYLGLLTIISEFGIGSAIVVLRTLTPKQLRQINSVSVGFGVVGFALSALLAKPIAMFFHSPHVAPVVVALSTTFLIGSFRTVPWALLQRDMRFKRVAAFEGIQQVVLAALSITLAILGFSYWTLVIASIVSASITAGFAIVFHWVGFEIPQWSETRQALTFSKQIILQRIAWFTYSNSDFLVAGRMLGAPALGAYTVGWTIANAPIDKIGNVILQVAPSALAAVQDDRETTVRYVIGITEALSVATFPLFVGLALVAPEFVPLILGTQWHSMIVPLQLLSLYACFRAILPLLSQVLVIHGHERFAARNMMAAAVALPITFVIASRWGLTGIALGWIIVHPLIAYRLCDKAFDCIGITFHNFFVKALWPALSGCGVMAVAVLALHAVWHDSSAARWLLPAEIAVGAVAYIATLIILHRGRADELRRIVLALRSRNA